MRTLDTTETPMTTLIALWSVATVVATLGAWLLFGATPGLNWALFGLASAAALLAIPGSRSHDRA